VVDGSAGADVGVVAAFSCKIAAPHPSPHVPSDGGGERGRGGSRSSAGVLLGSGVVAEKVCAGRQRLRERAGCLRERLRGRGGQGQGVRGAPGAAGTTVARARGRGRSRGRAGRGERAVDAPASKAELHFVFEVLEVFERARAFIGLKPTRQTTERGAAKRKTQRGEAKRKAQRGEAKRKAQRGEAKRSKAGRSKAKARRGEARRGEAKRITQTKKRGQSQRKEETRKRERAQQEKKKKKLFSLP